MQQWKAWNGILNYHVSVAHSGGARCQKKYGFSVHSFDTARHDKTPGLLIATMLCFPGRSVTRVLRFWFWITPFIEKIQSPGEVILVKYSKYPYSIRVWWAVLSKFQPCSCFSFSQSLNLLELVRERKQTITQHVICRWRKTLFHACSVTSTESWVTLNEFFYMFYFLLTCSKLTISTTVSEVCGLKKLSLSV